MSEVTTWLNKHRIRSTVTLCFAMYLLWDIQVWGKHFADTSHLPGLEIAAVLAAAQVPATLLAGWVFKIFQETKSV